MMISLREVTLENFRGVKHLNITLDERLTVLVGENGVGKTSIVKSIKYFLPWFWSHIGSNYPISSPESSFVKFEAKFLRAKFAVCYPDEARASMEFQFNEQSGVRITESPGLHELQQFMTANDVQAPLIVSYEQRFFDSAGRKANDDEAEIRSASLEAAVSGVPAFVSWYGRKDADEAREIRDRQDLSYRDHQLQAVRKIASDMEGFDGINYRSNLASRLQPLCLVKDGMLIPIDLLSSGELVYFMLAADLTRRLISYNPSSDPFETQALVLIDEIDLHLHPKWQREVMPRLSRMFPVCQFIITTHSPQVLGGVMARNIRLLERNKSGELTVTVPQSSKGRDSNFILEGLMEVPERENLPDQLIAEANNLMQRGLYAEASAKIDEVEGLIEGGSPVVTMLRARLYRRSKS